MKTKQIPAVIMLAAGLITSIAAVINHMETVQFLKILIIVLIIFYTLGCIIKVILDKNFREEEEEATDEAAVEEMVEEVQAESSQEEQK